MQRKVPSAITNITLNRATFTDVPIDELTFVNFFYGNNGAGKSSIAHAIAEDDGVVWADGKTADDFDVLVYNQDFINDNFVNYGDLKGVFIFGEEDIEAKKKIAELTDQKKQKMDARQTALDEHKKKTDGLASALTQFQDTCFSKTAEIRRRFDKCMDGKKQKKNLQVSTGIEEWKDPTLKEEGEPYNLICKLGVRFHEHFKGRIPVSCVNSIMEPELAIHLLEKDLVDTVDLGRAVLADPAFCEATLAASKGEHKSFVKCFNCPRCQYGPGMPHKCPAEMKRQKN